MKFAEFLQKHIKPKCTQEETAVDELEERALFYVLRELKIDRSDVLSYTAEKCGDMYELCFRTDWLNYDCYVNAHTGVVYGCSTEPTSPA